MKAKCSKEKSVVIPRLMKANSVNYMQRVLLIHANKEKYAKANN